MSRLTHWFLPEAPDLLGMLHHQAALTLQGMQEFDAWARGDDEAGRRVRNLEHEADEACRILRAALREAFSTPLEPEDLFSLSERLDVVLNEAKNTVREADLLGVSQDAYIATMAGALLTATEHVVAGLALLGQRHPPPVPEEGENGNGPGAVRRRLSRAVRRSQASSAPDAADRAVKAERAVEHEYRRAMSALSHDTGSCADDEDVGEDQETLPRPSEYSDVMAVMARQEVYRRFAGVGEAIVKVADRIWYASVKNG